MASDEKPGTADKKRNDDRSSRRTRIPDKRHQEAGENIRMQPLSREIYKSNNLQRHAERCAQGKTVIDCPGEKVEAPQTAYEKAFYPKHNASKESTQWLEYVAKRWNIKIAHAASGDGGERWIERHPVDGYNHKES